MVVLSLLNRPRKNPALEIALTTSITLKNMLLLQGEQRTIKIAFY